jgi:ATP-dependent Lhr-like helicase
MIPSWQGGRMPLSANLGFMLRKKFEEAAVAFTGDEPKVEGQLPIDNWQTKKTLNINSEKDLLQLIIAPG